ncbi:MAG: type II toxin-antitoxin system VapC family toxin [Solirubrobacteraceae bacterium]|nr:type II toxin-antitoxin system VapC family toxin [Solirubrobacteraceae bacterium]
MILVDTAVWIDHLRDDDSQLAGLLDRGVVLAHPWVTGELALGSLRARAEILRLLDDLPQAAVATAAEVRGLVEQHELFGLGIGYVDAQLLAATMLTGDAALWTRDRRLRAAARSLGLEYLPQTSS